MRFIPLDHDRAPAWKRWAPYAAILLGALILSLDGFDRSLWGDEAWVANSVHQPTLGGMFYYPEWLQTSPPLFLLIARFFTQILGLSTAVLRLISLFFAFIAAAGFLAVLRRVVAAPVALLAAVLLVFHPIPVEYFRSFKQYGAEMAATVLLLLAAVTYLKFPGRREFQWLMIATTLLLPLSYPLAFVLPGVVIAVWFTNRIRAAVLAVACAAVLGLLYAVFMRPNIAPSLWIFWSSDPAPHYGGGAAAIALVAAVAVYALWRKRAWIMLICLLPCALLLWAEVTGWYPASPRTRLFVRPCILLALAMVADDLFRWVAGRWRQAGVAVTLAAAVVMGWGFNKQFAEGRGQPHEDYIAAIQYLRANVAPGDVLLVHPSAREGFRLYLEIENWRPAVLYGDTGWPCCPREHAADPRSSTESGVERDLDEKIPPGTAGDIWLVATTWGAHWEYTGMDEGKLWRRLLTERGCQPGKEALPLNVMVVEMVCPANSP